MGEEVERITKRLAEIHGRLVVAGGHAEELEQDAALARWIIPRREQIAEARAALQRLQGERDEADKRADWWQDKWCREETHARLADGRVEALRKAGEAVLDAERRMDVVAIDKAMAKLAAVLTAMDRAEALSDLAALDADEIIGPTPKAEESSAQRWRAARVGRQILIVESSPESNAIIYPDVPEEGCYWSLIGCGSDEAQNALAQIIADALNAAHAEGEA